MNTVRKEEHKLSAINENEQPLLRTREYGKAPPRGMNREEAQPLLRTREYGTAPPPKVRHSNLILSVSSHQY